MTLLIDVAALLVVVFAALRGWRLGASAVLARAAGVVLGVLVGLWLAARVVSGNLSPVAHLLLGLALVLGCALLGGRLGSAAAAALVRSTARVPGASGVRTIDRFAGAALRGGVAAGVCSLLLGLVAGFAPLGWSSAVRGSAVASAFAPAGAALRSLGGGALDVAPSDIAALVPAADVRRPSQEAAARVAARVRPSVVEVLSDGCGAGVQGTGFVVGDGLVVTNAHVVRGSGSAAGSVQVETVDGRTVDATVVAFSAGPDLALLSTGGVDEPALTITDDAANGAQAVVVGYPGGVRTTTAAAVVERLPMPGSSVLTLHQAYVIDAPVRHGNSGSPLLDMQGRVVGVVNALSTTDPGAGFATTSTELRRVLASSAGHSTPVPTGTCDSTKGNS